MHIKLINNHMYLHPLVIRNEKQYSKGILFGKRKKRKEKKEDLIYTTTILEETMNVVQKKKKDQFEITLIEMESSISATMEIKPKIQTETGARKTNEMPTKVGCSTPPPKSQWDGTGLFE
eukprot:442584_1